MLVDDDLPHAKVVLADRGYDSDHIRNVITSRGGTPVIMGKANRKVPILVDTITYALRNRVERWCASRPFGSTNSNAPAASQHATIKPPQAISASLKSSPLASGSRVCQRDLAHDTGTLHNPDLSQLPPNPTPTWLHPPPFIAELDASNCASLAPPKQSA